MNESWIELINSTFITVDKKYMKITSFKIVSMKQKTIVLIVAAIFVAISLFSIFYLNRKHDIKIIDICDSNRTNVTSIDFDALNDVDTTFYINCPNKCHNIDGNRKCNPENENSGIDKETQLQSNCSLNFPRHKTNSKFILLDAENKTRLEDFSISHTMISALNYMKIVDANDFSDYLYVFHPGFDFGYDKEVAQYLKTYNITKDYLFLKNSTESPTRNEEYHRNKEMFSFSFNLPLLKCLGNSAWQNIIAKFQGNINFSTLNTTILSIQNISPPYFSLLSVLFDLILTKVEQFDAFLPNFHNLHTADVEKCPSKWKVHVQFEFVSFIELNLTMRLQNYEKTPYSVELKKEPFGLISNATTIEYRKGFIDFLEYTVKGIKTGFWHEIYQNNKDSLKCLQKIFNQNNQPQLIERLRNLDSATHAITLLLNPNRRFNKYETENLNDILTYNKYYNSHQMIMIANEHFESISHHELHLVDFYRFASDNDKVNEQVEFIQNIITTTEYLDDNFTQSNSKFNIIEYVTHLKNNSTLVIGWEKEGIKRWSEKDLVFYSLRSHLLDWINHQWIRKDKVKENYYGNYLLNRDILNYILESPPNDFELEN